MAEGFFGGVASGLDDARARQLEQQKQDAAQQATLRANAQKQISDTIAHIRETAKAAADAGNDPKSILEAVTPLVQSAQGLAQAAGIDPSMVAQQAQLAVMRPISTPEKKHSVVKIGSTPTGDQYGVLEQNSGTVTPIGSQPMQTATFPPPPGTVPQPNSQPATAVNPPPAPVAQNTHDAPVQPVAMRFGAMQPPGQPDVVPAPTPSGPSLPPNMIPGDQATVDYAINNNIVGPEYLKAIRPTRRGLVQDVADYRMPIETAPKSPRKGVDISSQAEVARDVHQYTNGTYDKRYYAPMQAAIKEFRSGGLQSPASQITTGNTAIGHAGAMADAVDKMSEVPGLLDRIAKSDMSLVSYAARQLKNTAVRGTSEGKALSAFMVARDHFAEETTKFYAGGPPSEEGRKRAIERLDAAKSAPELFSTLNAESEFMATKVGALQDRWKNGLEGPPSYQNAPPEVRDKLLRNAIPDFPILSESSKSALDRISQGYIKFKFANGQESGGSVTYVPGKSPPPPAGFQLQ